MKQPVIDDLMRRIKLSMWVMIVGLFISGITAFPIETQLAYFAKHHPFDNNMLNAWLFKVYEGVKYTNAHYPFISYGTDWLAFAHIMLAVLFIGPLKNPVKNIWVIQFGIIAAILIFPLAFIAGNIRGIPFFWQCIDCSFGLTTLAILLPCRKWIKQLETQA